MTRFGVGAIIIAISVVGLPATAQERQMNKLIQPSYELPGEKMEGGAKIAADQVVTIDAVASWKSTDDKGVRSETYYYNNVSVRHPYQQLNVNGNPLWIIEAVLTFSDVGWNYGLGEVITDNCGRRGQVDGSFVAPRANVFQLVPMVQERGGHNVIFNNNGCYNPLRVRWGIGGKLMIIPNDRNTPGAYADNSGSFDVKVTVIERLP